MTIKLRHGNRAPALDPIMPRKNEPEAKTIEPRLCQFRGCYRPLSRYNNSTRCGSCDSVLAREEDRRRAAGR